MSKDIKNEAIEFIRQELAKQLQGASFLDSDNLVQFGLSSIMVMQISSRLRKYGLRIPFAKLFSAPNLDAWIQLVEESEVKTKRTIKPNTNIEVDNGPFRLTDVQYAYLVGREEEQILGRVSCHAYMEFDCENIDAIRLEKAWNMVQNRHPMLRAKFFEDGMQQFMDAPYSKEITVIDCEEATDSEIEEKINELRETRSHRKLKVNLGQVAGLALVKLHENKSKMILDVDLLVADVASIGIILDDLAIAYETGTLKKADAYTFKNYLEDQLSIDSKKRQEDMDFWRGKINKMPECTPNLYLKTDPDKLDIQKFERRQKDIQAESWSKIKEIAVQNGVTPSMVLLSAYCLVIERWCNQKSFFVNLPLFNRKLENQNVERMVADFTNLLLVDFYREANETFLDTVLRIKKTFLENMSHDLCSGVEVQRMVQKKNGNINIVAPLVFACNIDAAIETQNSRRVFSDISYMISQTPQVWLDFQMYERDGRLQICWDSVVGLFEESMLEDMQQALVDLLLKLTDEKQWEICHDLLPEYQHSFYEKEIENVMAHNTKDKSLITDVMSTCLRNPDKIALIDAINDKKITYKKLFDNASKVANYLIENGVKPRDYVGVKIQRSLEQIYCCIGVLMAGACYVPIGVAQPEERIKQLSSQIDLSFVIENYSKVKSQKDSADYYINSGKDSAYIIMTSGSTGVPKCVEISHESAMNTIDEVTRLANVCKNTVSLAVASFDFDLSVYDMFGILGVGGTLVVLDEENAKNPEKWAQAIEDYGVNLWNSTPMAFDMCVTYFESIEKPLSVASALLSGDWIPLDLSSRFKRLNPYGKVIAMGGATEAAIWSNYLLVPNTIPSEWKSIPYGRPLAGQTYRVVDELNRSCPFYVSGELWIGGHGVAKGYKGDEKLTNQKFIEDGITWYKTGDQGMIWDDETIEFLGRKDHQVKIKGYRIEMGEVESGIKKIGYIKNAVVCVIDETKRKRLAAAVVLDENQSDKTTFDEEKLVADIRHFIPDYMVPESFKLVDFIPITANGKPDRKAIKQLIEDELVGESFVAPQGDIEKAIYKVWSNVLEIKEISREDNYFSIGGDSLKAVSIVAKLKKEVAPSIKWTTNMLYKSPTIKALGQIVAASMEEMEEDVI